MAKVLYLDTMHKDAEEISGRLTTNAKSWSQVLKALLKFMQLKETQFLYL